ncbi:MAG: outer membrane protein [Hyphomicrobiaceae bacterium]
MTFMRGSLLLSAMLLFFSTMAAQAGGLWNRGSVKDGGYRPAITTQPSWYARLDVAYGLNGDPDLVETGSFDLADNSWDGTWSLGVGFGRYFTANIRGDLTYDYRFESDVSGTAVGTCCDGLREFGLSSHLLLANLYYDFNRRSTVNPYLGVGLGVVYNETSTEANASARIQGDSNWDFAAAVMAGVGLKAGSRTNIDLGYRFLYLGEAQTGLIADGSGGNVRAGITADDLLAHEFRFGVRYDIN